MTIEEAATVNKGDVIIYISDDWNDNPIDVPVKVRNIWKHDGVVTHFGVVPINKKNPLLESAFAPILCFKLM